MKTFIRFIMVLALTTAAVPAPAGSLDNSGVPTTAGSGMPTLSDIYNQLATGATNSIPGTFQEPAAGPTAGTGRTLAEIQGKLPVPDNTNGAAVTDVLSGKTFWGLISGAGTWGQRPGRWRTGELPISHPARRPSRYWRDITAAGRCNTDANLVSGNIRGGATIFGVSGNVIQSTGTATVSDVLTGTTFSNATASGLTGSMANNGAVTLPPGATAVPVPGIL